MQKRAKESRKKKTEIDKISSVEAAGRNLEGNILYYSLPFKISCFGLLVFILQTSFSYLTYSKSHKKSRLGENNRTKE